MFNKFFIRLRKALLIDQILKNQIESRNLQQEILNGIRFNNTITNSPWFQKQNISPGRWAVDYGLLYTLYRTLEVMQPQKILEFGLGQSSKLIHQYASYYNCEAITIEHDPTWISFFDRNKTGEYKTTILLRNLTDITYKGKTTLVYEDLEKVIENQKFDLILVDGPFAQEHYSRVQILDLAQNHLSDRFCIIIDDYERQGEQETSCELISILSTKGIKFSVGYYNSSKQHILICSSDLSFLTSL